MALKSIWKFTLKSLFFKPLSFTTIAMPAGAQVLDAQIQNGLICLWALVIPGNALEDRKFITCGTGHHHENLDEAKFISTAQDGKFVWHVFEVKL